MKFTKAKRVLVLFMCFYFNHVEASSPDKNVVVPVLPDLFVEAAPLVAALTCRDGIALLVVHNIEEESLASDALGYEQNAGPIRIHPITSTTVLLPCGWRADGENIVRIARKESKKVHENFGQEMKPYHLCRSLSLTLAHQAVYSRPQSCAAIVASVQDGPQLWLMDSSGSYPLIAHCLGGGSVYDKNTKQMVSVKNLVQQQMQSWVRNYRSAQHQQPYLNISAKHGLQKLLSIFNDLQPKSSSMAAPFPNRQIELAILDASEKKLLKLQLADFS